MNTRSCFRFCFRALVFVALYVALMQGYIVYHALSSKETNVATKKDGVYFATVVMNNEKTGHMITFISMRHAANITFYDRVNQIIAKAAEAKVFMEGVDLKNGRRPLSTKERAITEALSEHITTATPADARENKLALQSKEFKINDNASYADVNGEELARACGSSFGCSLAVKNIGDKRTKIALYFAYPLAYIELNHVLIEMRNDHLLRELLDPKAPKHIITPWGAAHFPGVFDGLVRAGYTEVSREWIKVCGHCAY